MQNLSEQNCHDIAGDSPALGRADANSYMQQLGDDWNLSQDSKAIHRTYSFKNYYETMAFANVAAMVAHQQDHHPDMTVSYNRCHIEYSTHTVDGLSLKDFICAAKTDNTLNL